MMKGIADPLAAFRDAFLSSRASRGLRPTLWGQAESLLSLQILNIVEHTPTIDRAVADFRAAMEAYTGGFKLSSLAMRSDVEDERLFRRAETSLAQLRNSLRAATPSTTARHLCLPIDETEVPDPF